MTATSDGWSGFLRIMRPAALFAVLAMLFCLPAQAGKDDRVPDYAAVAMAIGDILNSPERLELPIERVREALKAHYIGRSGTVYWVGTGRMTPFIQRLIDAADDGLDPQDYPIETLIGLRDAITDLEPAAAAHAELYYSAFFVAYATDLKIGRLLPRKVDPKLFRNRKTVDVLRILTDLKTQRDPGRFLDRFEPANPHYRALKAMLAHYRALDEQGNWPEIAPGPNLKSGMSDPRIPQIRQLLAMTGDFEWKPDAALLYDSRLEIAVRRFQQRHGLEAKGLIGKQTLVAMNVPPAERARQIMLNMERWRWMPENLGDYHILVNLAAFELQEVQSSVIVDRMKVVVGAVATQTPEFSDEMEYVEFNPTWTVPYSIATGEMLPRLRQNPFAYAEDFDVFMNGQLVSWSSIAWTSYGAGNFPFTFRQRPGPKNALGKVKFMLPNPYNIYLHDTPAKEKFLATTRAFSHGCIRLSRPLDFAYKIVGAVPGWSKSRIDATLAAGRTVQVPLPRRIPVHLIYATAFKGENGIEFRADIYGRDRKLYAALFGRPES